MYKDRTGPILESRHHEGLQPDKRNIGVLIAVALAILLVVGVGLFFVLESEQQEILMMEATEEYAIELEEQPLVVTEEPLVVDTLIEEEGNVDFFYKRALQREKEKDYVGAVEDYTKTIALAKKYSSEMWNSLNNRGIIYAQEFKDYRTAKKDFSKISALETNRYNGEVNATRLEAGYTNRAYVKKMLGNSDGACDDLYEALALGIESSITFIENKIDKNCL